MCVTPSPVGAASTSPTQPSQPLMRMSTVTPRVSIGHYPRLDPVVAAARELGLKPGTVQQGCYGEASWFRRCALIVRAFVQVGKPERAERLLAPIDAARLSLHWLRMEPELHQVEQELDGREDEAQIAYILNPSKTNRDTYRRVLYKLRAIITQILQALEAEEREELA